MSEQALLDISFRHFLRHGKFNSVQGSARTNKPHSNYSTLTLNLSLKIVLVSKVSRLNYLVNNSVHPPSE